MAEHTQYPQRPNEPYPAFIAREYHRLHQQYLQDRTSASGEYRMKEKHKWLAWAFAAIAIFGFGILLDVPPTESVDGSILRELITGALSCTVGLIGWWMTVMVYHPERRDEYVSEKLKPQWDKFA